MLEFNACLNNAKIDDLKYVGVKLSWNNKRRGANAIAKNLDRVLGNWDWFNNFSYAHASFLQPGVSDHSLMIIHLNQVKRVKCRNFKFSNIWSKHPRFKPLV
ncbi:hypothetical protein CFOL_v3_34680 [Cephalotus follicularis]|uniref:Exo_endo_phos domain-containing protein n=1 Tax=Cephalotus follicularis TaxID=3775 RepID=A0A1Q3DG51_CEPFO|nr:hypothetical protein CFOL_v3_34680 [Cephalotus follicularis]